MLNNFVNKKKFNFFMKILTKGDSLRCVTVVLKNCVDIFAHAISHLANMSFATGIFPTLFKRGHATPLLKKKGSNASDPSNYRPITNLTTISKILVKLVLVLKQHC